MSGQPGRSILIVGAGPAGLAVGARLRHLNIPFQIVEQSDRIASSWHNHYDRLQLHTVKQHSALPFVPFPDDFPTYVGRQQLVDYCSNYADQFNLRPKFGVTIAKLERSGHGWVAQSVTGESFRASKVVVATGINRLPAQTILPDEGLFNGTVIHSRDYRRPGPYRDQRVLVVGMGKHRSRNRSRSRRYGKVGFHFGARTCQHRSARCLRAPDSADCSQT